MVEIPEDIILEILSFLPLKLLVRFKYLNKRLKQAISAPTFQNRRAILRSFIGYECIFHKVSTPECPKVSPTRYSTVLTVELPSPHSRRHRLCPTGEEKFYSYVLNSSLDTHMPKVLASSGGLLLLDLSVVSREKYRFLHYTFCLFNPATGAYQIIPINFDFYTPEFDGAGLALNAVVSKNHFSYKLVFPTYAEKFITNCQFWIYESESKSWHKKRTDLKSLWILPGYQEASYSNDSLYWLAIKGKIIEFQYKILAFNVKTEVAEMIDLPNANEIVNFGTIRDKLALISSEGNNKFSFWIYDFIHQTWKIDRIFSSHIGLSWFLPVFCDGNQLILAKFLNEDEGHIVGIRGNSTENILSIPTWSNHWSRFTHFLGTATEIPNCQYLINGSKGMKDHISEDEFVLQRHFEDLLFITKCCSFLE